MKTTVCIMRGLLVSALLAVMAAPVVAATTYRVDVLDDTGLGIPNAIGPTGVVAGTWDDQAVLWDEAGRMIDLTGGLGTYAEATDVNKFGQATVNNNGVPYLWSDGALMSINIGSVNPRLASINDAGVIAGTMFSTLVPSAYQLTAFTWYNGVVTELGTLPGGRTSVGESINNQGQVAGWAVNASNQVRAVLWNGGVILDLGTLPGFSHSRAAAINDAGQVVGYAYGGAESHGFLWHNGVMSDLGAFSPSAINNVGQIVGTAGSGVSGFSALLWSNGSVRDLSPVGGGSSCLAIDINDAGQIAMRCGAALRLTPTAAGTDVAVQLFAPTSAIQGVAFNYTIKVTNTASTPVTGVTVTDVLPAGVDVSGVVPSQGSCTGNGTLVCTLGELAVDSVATVQLTVVPNVSGFLTSDVAVAINETDMNALNNMAKSTVYVSAPVIPADMSVTISGPTIAKLRTNVTYTITVKNNGPGNASTVTLTNNMAPNLLFVSSATTQGTCGGASCSLGYMASGATATVILVGRPRFRGTYTTRSSLTFGAVDNNTANNSATITTVVR